MKQTLFLDDGGVLNENARRAPQFARLVARYLAPRLGGDQQAWSIANMHVARRLFDRHLAHFAESPYSSWHAFWDSYEGEWLGGMCTLVGVDTPADPEEARALARECDEYVTRRVRSALPGAVGAVRRLNHEGYLLQTASGESSWELDGYLTAMRVRHCFDGHLYGPDLVDAAKASPLYYERIFAHAGISSGAVVVVDDSEAALDWAAESGAQTVLCSLTPPANRRHQHIPNLAALPRLLGAAASLNQEQPQ